MLKRYFNKFNPMSASLIEEANNLPNLLAGKRSIDDDETEVNVRKKRERQIPVYDGDVYFDFKNCLRYVYPYEFRFRAWAKNRWFGRQIIDVYSKEFSVHSPNTLNYMFNSGKIKVNDRIVKPNYKIKNGDKIESLVHRHENPVLAAKINVIEDTDDFLVINKPSSIPVHTVGKYRLNTILGILSKEYSYKDLYTVHRLDRLTSGVLMIAKSPEKACELSKLFISKNVKKEYVCKVDGEFPEGEIVCTEKLDVLDKKLGFRFVNPDKGKECLTKFKRLYTDGKTSIVHCNLGTGRTHQIRVHLQYLGYPILNDPFYNSYAFGPNRGKGAEYLQIKTIKELISDLYLEHPSNKLHGKDVELESMCQDLEQSLAQGEFYDDVNFKLAEEAKFELIKNQLFDKHIKELEVTDDEVDKFIDNLANCEVLNTKDDIPYLKTSKSKKFNRDKFTVNVTCELCHLYHKAPKIEEMSLYLHAMRYTVNNGDDDKKVYFAMPPNWAQFDNQFDFSTLKF